MSAIEISGLTKSWGTTTAVDGISLTAEEGTLLVLLGPSGCGKSTLLRLIAGLEDATAGTIRIGGVDVSGLAPAKRKLSMVFQNYALFPHLSVRDNILFGLQVRKVPAAEQARRLDRVAELLGVGHLLDRRPSQLSGGQQQRVALGRAIIAETPVCLMDEPLSNLDAQLRHEMRREIRNLQQALGITMVYVTHDQTEAMSMADQVILLRDGAVEQDATPADLYARPATLFAASFIGTPPMNRIPLISVDGGAAVAGDPHALIWSDYPGEGLTLGLRPEEIAIRADGPGIAATVEGIEYFGADSIVACLVGGARILVRCAGIPPIAPGTRVALTWAGEAVHLFDTASGKRLDA